MEKTKEILKEIIGIAERDYFGFVGSTDRVYAIALASCLDDETRSRMTRDSPLEEYLEKCQELAERCAAAPLSRVNRPIKEVLADFTNPQSGRRQTARKELQERFATQSFKDQIAILNSMLRVGTMTDTAWVAKTLARGFRLLLLPDTEAIENTKELLYLRCDEHHRCPAVADYIVAQLPLKMVIEHQEELERIVGYRKVALRLAKEDPEFVIDAEKLTLFQYLDVLAKSGRGVGEYPVWKAFREWLLGLDPDLAVWETRAKITDTPEGIEVNLSLADISDVRWLVKSCGQLGLADVITSLYDLDKRAQALLQEFAKQAHSNHAIPYDSHKADRLLKNRLIGLAKEELDKITENIDLG